MGLLGLPYVSAVTLFCSPQLLRLWLRNASHLADTGGATIFAWISFIPSKSIGGRESCL